MQSLSVFDVELAEFAAAGKPSSIFNLDIREETISVSKLYDME